MNIKRLTMYLYLLTCIVGVASLAFGINNVAASLVTLRPLSGTSVKIQMHSDQIVNRALKSDRLPVRHKAPLGLEKGHEKAPTPNAPTAQIAIAGGSDVSSLSSRSV